jgi:hypothetical protein
MSNFSRHNDHLRQPSARRRESMPQFRTISVPLSQAATVEQQLQADGYVQRISADAKSLLPREFTKRSGTADPASFSGPPVVSFEIREA